MPCLLWRVGLLRKSILDTKSEKIFLSVGGVFGLQAHARISRAPASRGFQSGALVHITMRQGRDGAEQSIALNLDQFGQGRGQKVLRIQRSTSRTLNIPVTLKVNVHGDVVRLKLAAREGEFNLTFDYTEPLATAAEQAVEA